MEETKDNSPGLFKRFLARPSVVEIILTLIWLVLAVVMFSEPGLNLWLFAILFLLGLLLGVLWGLRFLVAAIRRFLKSKDRRRLLGRAIAWSLLPFVVFFAAGVTKIRLPLKVRLKLSEDALLEYVQTIQPGTRKPFSEHGHWVGLFKIKSVEHIDGCIRIKTNDGFTDEAGLAYSPKNPPPQVWITDSYRHLYGPWWHWHQGD